MEMDLAQVRKYRAGVAMASSPLPAGIPAPYIPESASGVDDAQATIPARFTEIQGPDIRDICYATQSRQSAVRNPGKLADTILGVGPADNSHSNRLRKIGSEAEVSDWFIADGSELNTDRPKDTKAVGIRRAPRRPKLVDDLIDAPRRIGPVNVPVSPAGMRLSNSGLRPN